MKNSNEMSNAVCDNCGALINSDCNSVTIEINQVPHEFCSSECDIERRANIALMNMTRVECCVNAGTGRFIQAVNGIVRVAANFPMP